MVEFRTRQAVALTTRPRTMGNREAEECTAIEVQEMLGLSGEWDDRESALLDCALAELDGPLAPGDLDLRLEGLLKLRAWIYQDNPDWPPIDEDARRKTQSVLDAAAADLAAMESMDHTDTLLTLARHWPELAQCPVLNGDARTALVVLVRMARAQGWAVNPWRAEEILARAEPRLRAAGVIS